MGDTVVALIVIAIVMTLAVVTVLMVRRRSRRRFAAHIGLPPLGSLGGPTNTDVEHRSGPGLARPERAQSSGTPAGH